MNAGAEQIEAEIRFKEFDLLHEQIEPGEFVLPHYEQYSLVNLANTVLAHFGLETPHVPLPAEFSEHKQHANRLVLLLIDALGYRQLLRFLDRHPRSLFGRLSERGRFAPLTSVFPSTTAAALATLHTGRTPAEHGILGYRLFLREFGLIANMIRLSPVGDPAFDRLLQMGLSPKRFFGRETLHERLDRHDVRSFLLIKDIYARSGLSKMLNRKIVRFVPFASSSDMSVVLKKLIATAGERAFIFVYWDALDAIAHRYGPESEEWDAELESFAYTLEQGVFRDLRVPLMEDTLFLITADHGQLTSLPKDEVVHLTRYPALKRRLRLTPTGEYRASYLYAKPDQLEALEDGLLERFADHLVVLRSANAWEDGLFGRGETNDETMDRVGDLVVVPKGQQALYWPYDEFKLAGRHGGLTDEEMLAPLIVF